MTPKKNYQKILENELEIIKQTTIRTRATP